MAAQKSVLAACNTLADSSTQLSGLRWREYKVVSSSLLAADTPCVALYSTRSLVASVISYSTLCQHQLLIVLIGNPGLVCTQ